VSGPGLLLLYFLSVSSSSSIVILRFRFIWSGLFGSMVDLIWMFSLGVFISFIHFFSYSLSLKFSWKKFPIVSAITVWLVKVVWMGFIYMSLFRDKPFNDFIFLHTSDGFVFPLMVDVNIFHESFLLFFIRYLLLALSLLSSIKFSGFIFF
jgi:hypothetical protein